MCGVGSSFSQIQNSRFESSWLRSAMRLLFEDHHSEESGVLKTNQWHQYIWILLQDHVDGWVATKLAEHKSLNPQWSDGTLRLQRLLQCLYVNNTLQICCTTDCEWYCVSNNFFRWGHYLHLVVAFIRGPVWSLARKPIVSVSCCLHCFEWLGIFLLFFFLVGVVVRTCNQINCKTFFLLPPAFISQDHINVAQEKQELCLNLWHVNFQINIWWHITKVCCKKLTLKEHARSIFLGINTGLIGSIVMHGQKAKWKMMTLISM